MPRSQRKYCSTGERSRPYCWRRKSIFAMSTDSPWLCSSAMWVERKSPGGSCMIRKVMALIATSVGIITRMRWTT
jgi:hypothetical protein